MKIRLKKPLQRISLLVLVIFTLVLWTFDGFLFYVGDHFFPGIKVAGIDLNHQTLDSSCQLLNNRFQERVKKPLKIAHLDQSFVIDLAQASPQLNLDEAIKLAYFTGRSGNPLKDLPSLSQALVFGLNFTPRLNYQKGASLISQINQINQKIKKEPVRAKITLGESITITPSQEGQEIDTPKFLSQIENYLNLTSPAPQSFPLKTIPSSFTTSQAEGDRIFLENIKTSPISLHWQEKTLTIDQKALFSILDFGEEGKPAKVISQKKLTDFLSDLLLEINQPSQEAKFVFDPKTKKVKEFQAAQEGREVDLEKTQDLITRALADPVKKMDLPVKITPPKTATADTNNFGITSLLGEGISHFAGSIENRIYNINLAASRLNGTLVAPGNVFSFNSSVGDISASSGFKQAYVIKEGRTVLDDGGGVCQVSTTLFRAVLNSGLPIIQRIAHAYRVGYYEQGFPPGLDATVFAPSVDLKFKNDTSSYILIQAYTLGTTLYIDLYGGLDGRVVTLTKPVISDQTPPPEDLKQDDPTLPKGVVKQVDWSAWGAKVSFIRTVKKDGEIFIYETWRSFYKPWQAVYLVGTKE